MKKMKRVHSNRGGALLSVIIVMAVVGILAALILSIAYTNFTMKNVDRKSKNNFYSAEMVLEEICAGLQKEISVQYKNAYTDIMENYGSYDAADMMRADFKTEFVLNMVDALKNGSDSQAYDVEKLKAYIKAENYAGKGIYTVSAKDGESKLDTLEDGLCLRNIQVTYEDGGYADTITTDIKIATPDVSFALISRMPEVADYSIIAQEGLTVSAGAAWKLNGRAFAGMQRDADGVVTDETAIKLGAASTLDMSDASSTLVISEGRVELVSGSSLTTGKTTSFWADSILTKPTESSIKAENILTLSGRTYVRDDTTLDGSGNTLNLAGQYYGYSNDDTDASKSSALIINGTDTTLDMSGLDTLVVAGTAFVGTKGEKYGGAETADDILMGDSIAVKGNQLAYLVPAECNGIGVNPMSYTQYEKLISNDHWETRALTTILSSIHRSIASYGDVKITPVFTNRSGGAVYLYLEFSDSNIASQYSMDYYDTDQSNMSVEKYLERYLKTFKFNIKGSGSGMSRLVTQGNYLVPATYENGSYKPVYKENTADVATTAQELVNYSSSYRALCKKLVENMSSLTSTELEDTKTVYTNLIDEDKIEAFFTASKASTEHSSNVTFDSSSGYDVATITSTDCGSSIKAIIVDNEGKGAYAVPTGGNGIIIASGDVTVGSGSLVGWNGLIVCKGRLTVSGGSKTNPCTLRGDADATSRAMQLICSVGSTEIDEEDDSVNFGVLNFFKGGGNFTVGSTDEVAGSADVRNCLSYENWKSE